jgi:ATP-dependent DNA helicase RecQ
MQGKKRIIVATNAFGMGINKNNVRFVIHFDIPDSIEAYFQEAGRAGRDDNTAHAIILYNDSDIYNLKYLIDLAFPSIENIRKTYLALGNYYQIAIGAGLNCSFDFDINQFSEKYNLNPVTVYYCCKYLEREGYITTTEAANISSKILFIVNRNELYDFQIANSYYDNFIKLLLRSYMGVFTNFCSINEYDIAKKAEISKEKVIELLHKLHKMNILIYIPQKTFPQIIFTTNRIDDKDITLSKVNYYDRQKISYAKADAIINYIKNENKCRSQLLLSYFGDNDNKRCGICDVCAKRNKINITEIEFDNIVNILKPILSTKPSSIDDIRPLFKNINEEKLFNVLRWLIDNNKIKYNNENQLFWIK